MILHSRIVVGLRLLLGQTVLISLAVECFPVTVQLQVLALLLVVQSSRHLLMTGIQAIVGGCGLNLAC